MQVIAALKQRDQPALAVRVRNLFDGACHVRKTIRCDFHATQRVIYVSVESCRNEHEVGFEFNCRLDKILFNGLLEFRIPLPAGKGTFMVVPIPSPAPR